LSIFVVVSASVFFVVEGVGLFLNARPAVTGRAYCLCVPIFRGIQKARDYATEATVWRDVLSVVNDSSDKCDGEKTPLPENFDQMVWDHLGLVHHVARKISRTLSTEADFSDLLSWGCEGLIRSVHGFEKERNYLFSTYAAPKIRGAILDGLRGVDHVSRSIRRKSKWLSVARQELSEKGISDPSAQDFAEHLKIDLDTYHRWRLEAEAAVRIGLERGAGALDVETPSEHYVPSNLGGQVIVEAEIDQKFWHEKLEAAFACLNEQETLVVQLYFYEEMRLSEIAKIIGKTESRVSQIRTKGIEKLRRELGDLMKDNFFNPEDFNQVEDVL
jgi:RNA polymerase sigma factor FliA